MHNNLNATWTMLWAWASSHPPDALAIALTLLAAPVFMLGARLLRKASGPEGNGQFLYLRLRNPLRLAWLLLILRLDAGFLQQRLENWSWVIAPLHLSLIAALTWLAMRLVRSGGELVVLRRGGLQLPDDPNLLDSNLEVRGLLTRARVLTRVLSFLILLVGLAVALMSIPDVRQIGASLLASAGIAGLVVGFAARPVLSNLLAGLQIAMTEPIRINDVLIVEGEWGRVEEITGTYVVFRVWDERRLILPLQWFIEHPFQNWTRSSASLLGTVFLWVDYATPIEQLRDELKRLCAADPDWDGRLALVHVTDATETAVQVRFLVSAANSARAWELRCRIREGMIAYMQRVQPGHLPRRRVQWHELAQTGSSPPPF
ncbi:putative MscS Mechanosensitive ion channel family protein [Thiomonas arsenitoxydans]|uniref:MscS Mechanosensitive ion channel family protein n=1 Tax=Thiomonas arsenitoxydans (strain DSM 22701 / CIP 110005 / 3As) TaxID=426114 RepID=D6CMP3_THIA3|nr:mechanosensitive ion channel domain-containing protein [Thiomonas arsenitoxydans]CQR43405.1 putative MscS Mechanosensitive ion channel family protein [Thiomonas sp. CB3]CAZ89821.1 putative MscS Mechanosensitive ion channel family protein [Thiomonas arsenitoxydans]CQR38146.1 putative MscS Mechanosensitive ion channel family protein [Thiomonas arsenitoxydans]CQR39083.1 putative MscS Mechanosensitive ion channel family protein [Thiomonas arsenitoxydans]CQR39515.1 putative MscS Mechanosensitive